MLHATTAEEDRQYVHGRYVAADTVPRRDDAFVTPARAGPEFPDE